MIDSTSWTGRPPGIVKWGFKGPKQLPLFMIWREYRDNPYDPKSVTYAQVIWSTQRSFWNWQDRIRRWIFLFTGWDQSKCWVCKGDTYFYPSNPFKRAYCAEHCPEHDFQKEPGEGLQCIHCAESPPYDYYD